MPFLSGAGGLELAAGRSACSSSSFMRASKAAFFKIDTGELSAMEMLHEIALYNFTADIDVCTLMLYNALF